MGGGSVLSLRTATVWPLRRLLNTLRNICRSITQPAWLFLRDGIPVSADGQRYAEQTCKRNRKCKQKSLHQPATNRIVNGFRTSTSRSIACGGISPSSTQPAELVQAISSLESSFSEKFDMSRVRRGGAGLGWQPRYSDRNASSA